MSSMADSARRACQDCDYWATGSCQRHPPIPLIADESIIHQWPQTGPHDWCGEYVSRTLQLSTEGQALAIVKGLAKELQTLAKQTDHAAETLKSVTGKGLEAQRAHVAAKHALTLAGTYLG